jgi:AcrR family transcriptional regulator
MKRLTRVEQSERNRGLVLAAARRVFLDRGYHGATLEQIADEAGFSKGVVYSQFESKADLFLALLEARISERAAENARLAESLPDGDLLALIGHFTRGDQATPGWQLLVIEFRVHAARDAGLNRRYAAAHARTVEALTGVLATVCARSGQTPAVPPRRLAELALALSVGTALEQAADPDALGGGQVAAQVARVLEPLARPPAAAPAVGSAGP